MLVRRTDKEDWIVPVVDLTGFESPCVTMGLLFIQSTTDLPDPDSIIS